MNLIRLFAMGAALCAAVSLTVTSAEAARRAKPSDVARISGCTTHVPPFCIGVHFRGTAYILSGVTPIAIGTGVKVVGRKTGAPGVCGGTELRVISWSPTRRVCK